MSQRGQEHLRKYPQYYKLYLINNISQLVSLRAKYFLVDGPGGTGKTFLYKALLAKVLSERLIDIAIATSGIAASILPEGTHSLKV
jgi:DNA replication protein DnaC